jgi:hypothetical protein
MPLPPLLTQTPRHPAPPAQPEPTEVLPSPEVGQVVSQAPPAVPANAGNLAGGRGLVACPAALRSAANARHTANSVPVSPPEKASHTEMVLLSPVDQLMSSPTGEARFQRWMDSCTPAERLYIKQLLTWQDKSSNTAQSIDYYRVSSAIQAYLINDHPSVGLRLNLGALPEAPPTPPAPMGAYVCYQLGAERPDLPCYSASTSATMHTLMAPGLHDATQLSEEIEKFSRLQMLNLCGCTNLAGALTLNLPHLQGLNVQGLNQLTSVRLVQSNFASIPPSLLTLARNCEVFLSPDIGKDACDQLQRTMLGKPGKPYAGPRVFWIGSHKIEDAKAAQDDLYTLEADAVSLYDFVSKPPPRELVIKDLLAPYMTKSMLKGWQQAHSKKADRQYTQEVLAWASPRHAVHTPWDASLSEIARKLLMSTKQRKRSEVTLDLSAPQVTDTPPLQPHITGLSLVLADRQTLPDIPLAAKVTDLQLQVTSAWSCPPDLSAWLARFPNLKELSLKWLHPGSQDSSVVTVFDARATNKNRQTEPGLA